MTYKLWGICFLHKWTSWLSCYEAGFVLIILSINSESDSYFIASLLMHLIILAGGGVGWGGVGCIYIYTSFEMLPFEKNTWNIYIFCFLIKKCFFFYVYNNNELCNMPHEYGRQLRYQWLHISITFVQNL